jgi:MFS family permease
MQQAWLILAALTLARMTMGFQFQSIAALGPALTADSQISYTQLGTLIGAYLLPGALIAIPGGWLGKRFGDKRVVLGGLAMMTAGGGLLVLTDVFAAMFAGRLVSGIGAVLLNVLVTKMVTDWFAEQRLATAMGVLISSWPLGIAIALLSLAPLEALLGLQMAFALPIATCALALLLVLMLYDNPPASGSIGTPEEFKPGDKISSFELVAILLAGSVWCLYNVAFILPLSFGPDYLANRGIAPSAAGAVVSLASWLVIPALPLGAWLAERIGYPTATMSGTFIAIAMLIWLIALIPFPAFLFAALGIVFGPAGGLIMALPAQVLKPQNRALGMGLFFAVYYLGMGLFPVFAGYLRDLTGSPAAPLYLAIAAILLALLSLAAFRRLQSSRAAITSATNR